MQNRPPPVPCQYVETLWGLAPKTTGPENTDGLRSRQFYQSRRQALDPEYATQVFKTDLQPSWIFRQLPGGGYWYLLYKYRRNNLDSMLRKYIGRARMEQLQLPMFTVAVDLFEGEPVVREVSDATISILERINLPPLRFLSFNQTER